MTVGMGQTYEALPLGALEALDRAGTIVVQTMRSRCARRIAERAGSVVSLDDLFEQAVDFDELYALGAARIWELEAQGADVCFCYLGEEGTNGFILELKKGMPQVRCAGRTDPVAEALFLARDLMEAPRGVMSVDARDLPESSLDTSQCVVVTGIDNAYTAAEARIALGQYYADDFEGALVLDGEAQGMLVENLDRPREWGEGGVLVLRAMALTEKRRFTFPDLVRVMAILRAPSGCPWDREQTHESLRRYIIEEAYEVSDAISQDDMDALADELGDVLLQIVFHAEIGRRVGEFNDVDVTTAICEKMIRRHPHVFGTASAATSEAVLANWDQIKREEKGLESAASVLEDVPASMGPLMRAYKLQQRAAKVGFDWPDVSGAIEKLHEELGEFEQAIIEKSPVGTRDEGGDLLFAAVNALRLAKVEPETALQDTCAKFMRRFSYMEEHAREPLEKMSLEQMDRLWDDAKQAERDADG